MLSKGSVTMQNTVSCKIEHHAILFALLAKEAILECGDAGKEAILEVHQIIYVLKTTCLFSVSINGYIFI